VLEIVMIAHKRHLYASFTYVGSDFMRAVACILPAILFRSLEWLLVGLVIFSGFRFFGTLLYLRHTAHSELRPDSTLLWKQFGYAVPFAIAVGIEIVQANYHMYVVSSSYDVAAFAVYAVGCLQIPLVDFLMTSTSNVMMVRIRENIQSGDSGSIPGIWLDTTRKLMLLFAPLVGGLLVVAHPLIVILFTDNYISSVPLFMLWTVSILFSALLTDSILRVYARTRLLIILHLIQLVIIAAMIRLFMSWFGLEGAVLASLLAMAMAKAAALYKIKHILKTGIRQVLPWNSLSITLAITAVAAVPALLIEKNLSLPILPLMLITGLSYAGMYVALLFFCGPLTRTEKHDLIVWLKWPFLRAYRNFVS
ncbi:MAG: lipopolysaccharide biosynthesis protein, partial [Gammaproteobacteria bacterium]